MNKIFLTLFGLIMLIGILQAQNYTISIMKSGSAIGKYKLADIDSIIFYKPAGYTGTTVTDIEGNVYKTVTIKSYYKDTLVTQVWMAENLKTTKYKDGTDILLVAGADAWNNLTTPAYCWYTNDSVTYANPYGALYNWYSVETGNLCPTGWHIPIYEEWEILGRDAGASIESGTSYLDSPNTEATNITGFSALPGGLRSCGNYLWMGYIGYWWINPEDHYDESAFLWGEITTKEVGTVWRSRSQNCNEAVSIRCIKD